MNNKMLSVVLVTGILVTGFAGISAADEGLLGENIEQKIDAVEDKFEQTFKGSKFGKRKWLKHLSDEEKAELEDMSDEQKKEFFDAKKSEMKARKEAKKTVMAKLIAGESLTAAEEALRWELLMKAESRAADGKKARENSELIIKVLAGDELTTEDQTTLADMQAKREVREAQRELIQTIKAKLDAGEQITDAEQQLLDEAKSERKWKKKARRGHGKWSKHDREDS